MSYHTGDTICAIGTAAGGAARGMIRISGPEAVAVVGRVFSAREGQPLGKERRRSVIEGRLSIPLGAERAANPRRSCHHEEAEYRLPCDLFLWPAHRSYTREPVAELHTLGSPPVLQAALANVCRNGARLAEPGEFTLRAFLAGRIDLTQAEAVLGVIDARGEEELEIALEQLAGGMAEPLDQLRDQLLQLLAELEAGLDFVEEDIRFISREDTLERLAAAHSLSSQIVQQLSSRTIARELPQVVLTGRPNVGKSSLFNALAARYRPRGEAGRQAASAIVSARRGTTRDYLSASIEIGGTRCELVDTAGIDAAADQKIEPLDTAAQDAAIQQRRHAAIRAWCVDFSGAGNVWNELSEGAGNDCEVVLLTKTDLGASSDAERCRARLSGQLDVPVICTSSHRGSGLEEFGQFLHEFLARNMTRLRGHTVGTTAERCRESVRLATGALEAARGITKRAGGDELVAAEIRLAVAELGKMAGAVYTDDMLDRIFRTFCIGK